MAAALKLGGIRLARWGLVPLAVAASLVGMTGPAGASGSPRAVAGTFANARSLTGDSAGKSFCGLLSTGHIDCRGTNALTAVVPSPAAEGAKGTAPAASKGTIATEPSVSADWPQLGYGPDRNGYQPDETEIGTANVATLSKARTYLTAAGGVSAPLISNGILYVDNAGYLYAFDATGATGCSGVPATCNTPLWKASAPYASGMTVADGVVFVTLGSYGVRAFDAAGLTNCSGTPKVCLPLWSTSTNTASGPGWVTGSGEPVVADGILYVPGYGDGIAPSLGGAYVAAFDAAGSRNCQVYTGFGDICVPMWTTTGVPESTGNTGSPTVAGGVLYIADGPLFAFDAAGSNNCSGAPTVCGPLWTAPTTGYTYSAPSVADGIVYVGTWDGKLLAFDAAGGSATCSGTPKTCTPLWTSSPMAIGGIPAVANGVVYTVSASGTLSAFDAAGGSATCSGTPRTCTPLWSSAPGGTGYATSSSPAVANGVVYFASTTGEVYGFDASGSPANCSGIPKICTPLWGANPGSYTGTPAVANGVVYFNGTQVGSVWAYSQINRSVASITLKQTPKTPLWDLDLVVKPPGGLSCPISVTVTSTGITATASSKDPGSTCESIKVRMPVFEGTNEMIPDGDNDFSVQVSDASGTLFAFTDALKVPPPPIWIALGDSTSSGWNQKANNWFSYRANDAGVAWPDTAYKAINTKYKVPSVWAMAYLPLAVGGETSTYVVETEAPKMVRSLSLRTNSWNVVSVTGGANDLDLSGVLKEFYCAHVVRGCPTGPAVGNKPSMLPWAVPAGDTAACPNTTSMEAKLKGAVGARIKANIQKVLTDARKADNDVRLVDQWYQQVVPVTNTCGPNRTTESGAKVYGATQVIEDLNAEHQKADRAVGNVAVLNPAKIFEADPLAALQLFWAYGFPHVNLAHQRMLGDDAARLVENLAGGPG
jgi:outer membrane protein assembly factor BamB